MKITRAPLDGLLIVEPDVFADDRGSFLETYQVDRYRDAGILDEFVQDNQSRSRQGVLRGLHYQVARPQSQLVTVLRGRVFDVAVDLRSWSPTFGLWYGVELSDEGVRQLYMPPGFAHGFCVLSDWADLHYKVSRRYDPHDEGGLRWDDPTIGIDWPLTNPTLTPRDAGFPLLSMLTSDRLPQPRTAG